MLSRRFVEFLKSWLVQNHEYVAHVLPHGYRAYSLYGGKIYLNVRESALMLERALGRYEMDKMEAVQKLLRPGVTFIDVGANKGDFSLLAAMVVGNDGRILVFEPEPMNCKWIGESIRLNGYKNISVFDFALSDTNGPASLYLGEKSGLHTLLPGLPHHDKGTITISARTLDDVLADVKSKEIAMMKIDVEGAELRVLKGAERTLVENQNIILLIDIHPHLGVEPEDVMVYLRSLGFSMYQMKSPFNVRLDRTTTPLEEVLAYRKLDAGFSSLN